MVEVSPPADPRNEGAIDLPDEQIVTTDADVSGGSLLAPDGVVPTPPKMRLSQRIESYIETLSQKNRFWQMVCSKIWLPFAFHSGLRMKKLDTNTFTYVLPFRRFNRNWYRAMAGAALVGNSELAAGMYLFNRLGGQWTIICKEINYRFLRPCFGPAIYRVVPPAQDIDALLAANKEFNLDLTLNVLQQVKNKGRQPRVGRCGLTFHCTPKDADGNLKMLIRAQQRKRREAEQTQQ